GITPLESMACGTPVIGANVGGIKYSVLENETGFLVPPKEPDLLAQQLARLYASPRLGKRLGRRAVRRVNDLFTWQAVTHSISELYANVRSGTPIAAASSMADAA